MELGSYCLCAYYVQSTDTYDTPAQVGVEYATQILRAWSLTATTKAGSEECRYSNGTLWYTISWSAANMYYAEGTVYKRTNLQTTKGKGTKLDEVQTSYKKLDYPANGEKDGKWYILTNPS